MAYWFGQMCRSCHLRQTGQHIDMSHRETAVQPQLSSAPGTVVQLTVDSHTSPLPSPSPFLPMYKIDKVGLKLGLESCILAAISHCPKYIYFILLACVFCLHICVCAVCMPGTLRGKKRALDPLQLVLQMAVSQHMGARNQTWVLREGSWCS